MAKHLHCVAMTRSEECQKTEWSQLLPPGPRAPCTPFLQGECCAPQPAPWRAGSQEPLCLQICASRPPRRPAL